MLRISSLTLVLLASAAIAAPAPTSAPTAPATAAVAAQSGRTARTTDLRDKPANDGAMLQVVPANTTIEIAERQGGWYKVKVDGSEGWMRLSAVRIGAGGASVTKGSSSPLSFLQSGRSAVTTGSVTTGVRGLSEEGLQNATPDFAAVAKLDALSVSTDDARGYANELKLVPSTIPYIAVPEEAAGSGDKKRSKRKAVDESNGGSK